MRRTGLVYFMPVKFMPNCQTTVKQKCNGENVREFSIALEPHQLLSDRDDKSRHELARR